MPDERDTDRPSLIFRALWIGAGLVFVLGFATVLIVMGLAAGWLLFDLAELIEGIAAWVSA